MKTRIISGTVLVLVAALILGISLKFAIVLPFAFALLGVIAVKEVLYNTGIVKNKIINFVGNVLAAVVPFVFTGIIPVDLSFVYTFFVVLQFALYLKFHKEIGADGMFGMILMPIVISYGFSSFSLMAQSLNAKLFYVVLVLCWSAVADMGAYFIGVFCGRHKMAPVVSPKKTWEGFIGGMLFSILAVLITCLIYKNLLDVNVNILSAVIITPLFVALGVLGDLTASLIKRKCDIKDFGNIIPGHGGIMDRFDSMLMIAPFFCQVLGIIPLIGG